MKKMLLGLFSVFAVVSFSPVFASVTPQFHSYHKLVAQALTNKITASDSGTITVTNFDIYDSMNAFFSIDSTCDTPFAGNGSVPGQLLPRSQTGIDIQPTAPDTVCLYDTTSGDQFFEQTITPPAMVTAYVDANGKWEFNVTPIS